MNTYQKLSEVPEGFVPLSALKFDNQSKNVLRTAVYEDRIKGCGVQREGYRYSQIWVHPKEALMYLEVSRKGTVRSEWEATAPVETHLNWFQRAWARVACALAR